MGYAAHGVVCVCDEPEAFGVVPEVRVLAEVFDDIDGEGSECGAGAAEANGMPEVAGTSGDLDFRLLLLACERMAVRRRILKE